MTTLTPLPNHDSNTTNMISQTGNENTCINVSTQFKNLRTLGKKSVKSNEEESKSKIFYLPFFQIAISASILKNVDVYS